MYKMDEMRTRIVPIRLVLILSICLGGLLTHFLAEIAEQIPQSNIMELIDNGGNDDPDDPAGEDAYILPEFYDGMDLQSLVRTAGTTRLVFASLASLPLLPPPIAN